MKPKRYPYSGQKKRLPKVVNAEKALEIVINTIDSCALDGFPKIDKGRGSQVRYPRDQVRQWFNNHWKDIA